MFLSNCTVSILRGTYISPFGDPVERDDPVHTGIPASIRYQRSDTTTISEGLPRQVRFLVGRLPGGTDVQHEDRLRNEQTGKVYLVDEITSDSDDSPIMDSGVTLGLRRVQ